jgi:phospholipid/cholesterol/gamma-HCH transport system substrate-binding protein
MTDMARSTLWRVAALGVLALIVVVVAVVLLTGDGGHPYRLLFENAGQLVKGDDVQVGGRRVGNVDSISLTNDNQAEIKITVEKAYAPLHEGTTAQIRATSLSGIANRYVALTLGPNNRAKLADHTRLPTTSTNSIVDLDQVFNTLDPKTLKGLQDIVQGSATQYAGVAKQANQALHYFSPTLGATARLANELDRDTAAFTNFVVQTSNVVTAVASRSGDLTNLVSNAATTAGAIGAENQSFDTALQQLAPTLRRANTTFVDLRSTLDALDPLVNASKPATKRLAPVLKALRPLVGDAIPTVADLRSLIRRPRAANDLIEVLQRLPKLAKVAKPTFANGVTTLNKSEPVLNYIRPYTPDLVGWIRDFGQGAQTYDANGHYARIQPIFNVFSFADNPLGGVLNSIGLDNRLTGLSMNEKRCPGAAAVPAPDGGNPYRDTSGTLDCDPSQRLPSP